MQEKEILIEEVNPLDLFGANEAKLNLIKQYYPKLKIVARGNQLKIFGDSETIQTFEKKLNLLIHHIETYSALTTGNIEELLVGDNSEGNMTSQANKSNDEVLVYGNRGLHVKARTKNQRKLVEASEKNDMIFAVGPAGTGKTYTAVALAVRALKNKEVKRIILTRPAVEAGENLGFLPGDLKEKLDPYLRPLYDALQDMIRHEKLNEYLESGTIQIAPLAFMRGRTLDNAFVILDEAQNATYSQMKMFLTRMGKSAQFIITGDASQVDLPKNQRSGLITCLKILKDIEGVSIIKLDGRDVIRHKLVKRIISAFESNETDAQHDKSKQ